MAEFIFGLVGVGFLGIMMLCYLPGGGGAQAVAALGSLALTIGVVAVIVVGLLAVFSIARRSKSDDTNQLGSTNHCLHAETAAVAPLPSRSEPAPLTKDQIAKQIRDIDWYQFEKLVALTYRKLGYTVDLRGGANPDGGIDLTIQKGVGEPVAVQCKHWQNRDVGVAAVREFGGALADAKIKTGIFVTLNGYTGEAKQFAERNNIAILNQTRLVEMLEQADVRFDTELRGLLTDTRKVCPKCESELVLRTTKKGPNAGRQFWGCSTFPGCRFQMPVKL